MQRERYIPKGYKQHLTDDVVKLDIYIYDEQSEKYPCSAVAFSGRRSKADWRYKFRNNDELTNKINSYRKSLRAWEQRKQERKAERQKPHTLKVGDILSGCWGYEQTNWDFYQVTEVVSGRSVKIRPIGAELVKSIAWAVREITPVKGKFIGDEVTKRASSGNSVKIKSYLYVSPWSGKPVTETSYH